MIEKAKQSVETGYGQVKRWWVKKYKLPPNHELFESQSIAELTMEMYEDMLLRKQEIMEDLETATTKQAGELYRQLNSINSILGEGETVQDELIDRWERELESGILPDLNEG